MLVSDVVESYQKVSARLCVDPNINGACMQVAPSSVVCPYTTTTQPWEARSLFHSM